MPSFPIDEARTLRTRGAALAEAAVDRLYASDPALEAAWRAGARESCVRDLTRHLECLADSLSVCAPDVFRAHVAWAKAMFIPRGIGPDLVARSLAALRDAILAGVEGPIASRAAACIDDVLAGFEGFPDVPPSEIASCPPESVGLAGAYLEALLSLDRESARAAVIGALESGLDFRSVYLGVLAPVQREIGRLWQIARLTPAHEHYASAVTQSIMAEVYARIPRPSTAPPRARVLVACAEGELHEIGARMVADMLEAAHWRVVYLGANVPGRDLAGVAGECGAEVVALSVNLASHLAGAACTIGALRSLPSSPRVVVGGHPFTTAPDLWRKVGADAGAGDAGQAVACVERLVAGAAARTGRAA